jgi:hypothetical protein
LHYETACDCQLDATGSTCDLQPATVNRAILVTGIRVLFAYSFEHPDAEKHFLKEKICYYWFFYKFGIPKADCCIKMTLL